MADWDFAFFITFAEVFGILLALELSRGLLVGSAFPYLCIYITSLSISTATIASGIAFLGRLGSFSLCLFLTPDNVLDGLIAGWGGKKAITQHPHYIVGIKLYIRMYVLHRARHANH